jgi:thioredoxin-like negative regulator of GroEL
MLKIIISLAIVVLMLGSFYFFYKQSNKALYLAARHLENVSLEYYTNRAMVQKKPLQSLSLRDEIKLADLQFQKNPKLTAVSYESLLKKDPGNNSIQLRLGMIYLKMKQYDAAKEHFYFVYENEDSGLQPDAAWFLGLITLIEEDKVSAKSFLQESLQKKCSYKKEAAELLEYL